jgi:indoleamine 2,3-dioxygenase
MASTAPLDDLKAHDLDPVRGFLPAQDPLTELPSGFEPWDELAAELPRLLLTGRLRPVIESLPELDPAALGTDAELRRAMLVLSFLGHAYVWSGAPVPRIPRSLALPWCAVAERLGRPPVLSYASYALDNWRLYDPDGPVVLGNLALLQNFAGGADEDWFIGVHIEIEFRAAPILAATGPLLGAVAAGDARAVEAQLGSIAHALESLVGVLRRMPEHCDPYIYYQRVRPYIHGWANHPALPQGVVYEGVERLRGRGQKLRGETGAQSGIVPVLDALLRIEHEDDPLRGYLQEMRAYMPPAHRAFLEAVESGPDLRAYTRGHTGSYPELAELYDECLHWLEAFRTLHLDYAASYIFRQAQASYSNPTALGTGGTPFMPYLKKHRDETAQQRLASPDTPPATR